jgi:hypothetical protein
MVTSPAELGPKNDYAGEAQQDCKRQSCPLVRAGAPHQQTLNYLTVKKSDLVFQMGLTQR